MKKYSDEAFWNFDGAYLIFEIFYWNFVARFLNIKESFVIRLDSKLGKGL